LREKSDCRARLPALHRRSICLRASPRDRARRRKSNLGTSYGREAQQRRPRFASQECALKLRTMLATHPSALESLLVSYARRFPIRRGKLRVVDSLWRAAAGDRSTRRLADLRHGGLKMPCDLTEMLQRQFYFFGTYFLEEHILECWESAAKDAKLVLDVGAN